MGSLLTIVKISSPPSHIIATRIATRHDRYPTTVPSVEIYGLFTVAMRAANTIVFGWLSNFLNDMTDYFIDSAPIALQFLLFPAMKL